MYKHLFGPVPSRRLGMSLGVDLVPHKVCTLNCVYCECGKTTLLTHERKEYVPLNEIREELLHYFSHHPDPDYITFSGAGEPTLHSGMGEVLDFIRERKAGIKVAVITNGTLFSDSSVRKEIQNADVVLPSLDAATPDALAKINRPGRDLSLDAYVDGLIQFRKQFRGLIWLEILIIPGYNDDEDNLRALSRSVRQIKPDKIQLNTLDRPGVVDGLRAATREELESIAGILNIPGTEIVLPNTDASKAAGFREDTEAAILETIVRRPCTLSDLEQILGIHINEINKYLRILEESGRIEVVKQDRGIFYQVRLS